MQNTARWLTNLSHRDPKNIITATTEIRDPNLAIAFQQKNASG